MRLTKKNRESLLRDNDGYTSSTSYTSRNHSYDRNYQITGNEVRIRESGKTSWADSRYQKEWTADEDETRRFLKKNLSHLNTSGIE